MADTALATIDQRLHEARLAWISYGERQRTRMAALTLATIDTLLDVRNAVQREDGQ